MAAMNLNPLVRLFFFFCYLLFCFQFFQICFEYPKVDNERCYRFRGLRFRDTRFLGITIDAN